MHLPDDECVLFVVAFGGDDGDVGAAGLVADDAPIGTDEADDSVGVDGGEFAIGIVLADPRPKHKKTHTVKLH